MKLNKYLMFAMAGVAFAACSNEDEVVPSGNQDGRVYVNLSLGSAEARSVGQSASGLKNDVDNVTIYFYTANGTYLQDVQPGTANDNEKALAAALETLKTAKSATVSLTGIQASANQIYIVVNEPTTAINKTSLTNARKSIINLSEQVATTFTRFSGEKSTLTGLATITDGADNKSTANVKLTPVPSRIEVQNFIATTKPADFGGSEIEKFDVTGIYINAFYTQGYLDITDKITDSKVDMGGVGTEYTEEKYGVNAFMCDDLAAADITSAASTVNGEIWKVSPAAMDGVTSPYWGYQVLKGDVPHMIVKMNVTYVGATTPEVRFLTITGYKKTADQSELTEVKRGEVYRITNLKFDASDLTPNPYEKTKTISATVEVLAWEGVDIEPNL